MDKGKPLPSVNCFEHCYVMLTKGTKTLESRGYFQDVGSVQEKDIFGGARECRPIMKGQEERLIEEWSKITSIYDKCRSEDYSVTSHNCCSVAREAIKAVVGTRSIPLNIENANSSIGTKCFNRYNNQ